MFILHLIWGAIMLRRSGDYLSLSLHQRRDIERYSEVATMPVDGKKDSSLWKNLSGKRFFRFIRGYESPKARRDISITIEHECKQRNNEALRSTCRFLPGILRACFLAQLGTEIRQIERLEEEKNIENCTGRKKWGVLANDKSTKSVLGTKLL